jgi:hypothetical protein
MGDFPNHLFEDNRKRLAEFGFRPLAAGDFPTDWAAMWEKLKADFACFRDGGPAYAALRADQRAAAQLYMERRLVADRRLIACERCHGEMLRQGMDNELVELYAAARESYEEAVEAFGAAREKLEALLDA